MMKRYFIYIYCNLIHDDSGYSSPMSVITNGIKTPETLTLFTQCGHILYDSQPGALVG